MFKLILIFTYTTGRIFTQNVQSDFSTKAGCENQGQWLKAHWEDNIRKGYIPDLKSVSLECTK